MRARVKNMLSVLLILIMVLSHVCLFSAAKAETGKCGKNATWTLQNGTLTISGTGNIYNYEMGKSPWTQATASIKRIVVGEGIRHIGNWAFENCNQLKAVRLPSTLTSIGAGSFFFCWQLKKLTLPDGVKRIGDCAFERCKTIKEMIFPDSVKSLGEGVLFYCTSLKRVVLLQGITAIPASMFGRCGELKSIELPETIRSIGAGAFDNCCGLTAITFPENLQVIQGDAFLRTGLRDVTLPASVRRVGAEAFGMSFDLKTLTILNPNCVIEEDPSAVGWLLVPETTVLRGYKGSTTEAYAASNGRKFESIGDSPTPTKLTDLQLTAESGQQIRLTWDAQQCAKGYQVYRSTSKKAGSFRRIAVVRDAAYTDSGLNPGTTYYYVVRAYAKQDGKYIYGAYAMAKQTTRG